MKIIDFERKGNVVKYYLGDDQCDDYTGDDWDDKPYEHNAGVVYDEYVKAVCVVAYWYNMEVVEPKDDWHYGGNSPFCKDDFKNGKTPCLIIVPTDESTSNWDAVYSQKLGDRFCKHIYYNDSVDTLFPCSGVLMSFRDR